jgi:hypothetical protein
MLSNSLERKILMAIQYIYIYIYIEREREREREDAEGIHAFRNIEYIKSCSKTQHK